MVASVTGIDDATSTTSLALRDVGTALLGASVGLDECAWTVGCAGAALGKDVDGECAGTAVGERAGDAVGKCTCAGAAVDAELGAGSRYEGRELGNAEDACEEVRLGAIVGSTDGEDVVERCEGAPLGGVLVGGCVGALVQPHAERQAS